MVEAKVEETTEAKTEKAVEVAVVKLLQKNVLIVRRLYMPVILNARSAVIN